MKIRGLSRVKQATQKLRKRFAPGSLILLYHRITELPTDPFNLCVTPQNFAEHLAVIKENAYPMSLQQLVQAIQAGKQPNHAVVITFDDGYMDNLQIAKPLLQRYDIPATVFVSTGKLGQGQEFWWDELDRLLLQPGTLPDTLSLTLNSNNYHWNLGKAARYSKTDYERYRTWNWYVSPQADPTERHQLYRSLYQILSSLPTGDRQQLLDEILAWSGAETIGRSTHRLMSPKEVCTLSEGNLIEVGAHTVNHPFLSTLPIALQQQEIQQSKTDLEALVGHPINSFAYPHGNYTQETPQIVHESGFNCACSTVPKTVQRQAGCFELPRVGVENWNGEKFAKQLAEWFQN